MATDTRKPVRRIKPEVAAEWAARRREAELKDLYQQPVEHLSPDEIARMKAAFFQAR